MQATHPLRYAEELRRESELLRQAARELRRRAESARARALALDLVRRGKRFVPGSEARERLVAENRGPKR